MNTTEAQAGQAPNEIDLRWVVTVLRHRIGLIAGTLLLVLLATYLLTFWQAPVYAATTTLFVEPAQNTTNYDYNLLVTGERLAITYSQMLNSRPVLEEVRRELGTDETIEVLSERMTVVAVQDTQLLRLTARAATGEEAQRYADTTARVFIRYIQSLETARYQSSLDSLYGRMETLSAEIAETQALYDERNQVRIQQEAELTRLENVLADHHSDYQTLQDDYQALQMQVDQLSGSVFVIQPATEQAAVVVLLVGQAPDAQTASYASDAASLRIAQTYGKMLTARPVLDEALARLDANDDSALLAGQITVEPVPGTQLLQVAVHNLPADQAALLANTVVAVFIEQNQAMLAEPYTQRLTAMQTQLDGITAQIEATQREIKSGLEGKVQAEAELAQLDSQLTADRNDLRSLQQDYEALSAEAAASANAVVVTEQAIADQNPAQGRLPFLLLGGVAGLLAGIGLAFVVEQLNDKIRTPQDVRQALGVSPIGLISQRPRETPELFASTAASAQTEEFWLLSTSIRLATLDRPLKSLLVTSPTSSEGKSLVAANLAATFARSGERVILVDADLHFPRLHQIFNLSQEKGLTNLLLDGDVQAHLKPAAVDGLCVLTSGDLPGDVVDIFSLPRLEGVIDELTRLADLVIIDCPPVLAVADTSILASFIDGALLVLRSGKSGREVTRSAVERLRKTKTTLLGVVLNSTHQQPPNDYYRSRTTHRNGRVNGKTLKETAAAPVEER